jgi:fibronectin-binding autotransporter adhesin
VPVTPNPNFPRRLRRKSFARWFYLSLALASVFATARAATIVWNNGTTVFLTPTNWVGGFAPANDTTTDIASFGTVTVQPALTVNRSIAGLEFTSTSGVTLSGAVTLTLGASGINNASLSGTKTISAKLALGSAQSFVNDGVLTISGTVALGANLLTLAGTGTSSTLSGIISGTGGLNKSGTGTWIVSGANTFTGPITVTAGTLKAGVASVANVSGAFGKNTAVTLANTAGALIDITGFNTQIGSLSGGGATGGNVTLGAAALTVGGDNSTPSAYAGDISGTGTLIKIGTGTLTLGSTNTYTGATTINNGTLLYGATNVIADTSAVTINATTAGTTALLDLNGYSDTLASLTFGGTGATATSTNNVSTGAGTLTLNGGVTYTATNNPLGATLSGNLSLGTATRTFTIADSTNAPADLTVSAAITSGSGGALIKAGTGTLVLSGANAYTGLTTVSAGVLNLQNALALGTTAAGTTVTSGAALQLQGGFTITGEALTLNGTGLTATGALLNLSDANTWANAIVLGSATQIQSDAGTLTLSGALTGATFGLTFTGSGDTAVSGTIGTTTGTLTKTGTGTLTLSGANTYTGATTINNGTLLYGASNVTADTSAVTINATTAGTTALLDLNGFSDTLASLTFGGATATATSTNNVSTGAGTLTLNGGVTYTATNNPLGSTLSGLLSLGTAARTFTIGNSTNAAADLTVSAAITSGAGGALIKTGAGTLLLSGTNTYTGATTVNLGTLQLGSSSSLPATTAVTVNATTAASTALLDLNDFNATIAALTFGGTGATATSTNNVSTGAGTLTLGTSGAVTYSATTNPLGATLSGLLDLGSTTHIFNIADSTSVAATSAELTVSALISGTGGITKSTGTGLLLNGVPLNSRSSDVSGIFVWS